MASSRQRREPERFSPSKGSGWGCGHWFRLMWWARAGRLATLWFARERIPGRLPSCVVRAVPEGGPAWVRSRSVMTASVRCSAPASAPGSFVDSVGDSEAVAQYIADAGRHIGPRSHRAVEEPLAHLLGPSSSARTRRRFSSVMSMNTLTAARTSRRWAPLNPRASSSALRTLSANGCSVGSSCRARWSVSAALTTSRSCSCSAADRRRGSTASSGAEQRRASFSHAVRHGAEQDRPPHHALLRLRPVPGARLPDARHRPGRAGALGERAACAGGIRARTRRRAPAHILQVSTVTGGLVAHNVVFADPGVFDVFELPRHIPAGDFAPER
ncbi:hypothetical protein SAMN05216533_8484 [Streptomyces sp. Ag109_O5-10]|nr:hypothetical protein SAMN05216533_8484 [Streptomyces sp. Ag109_O5-10]